MLSSEWFLIPTEAYVPTNLTDQIERMKIQIRRERVTIHSKIKFFTNLFMGGTIPAIVLGYPLIYANNLDEYWKYLLVILIGSMLAVGMSFGAENEKAPVKKEFDNLCTQEYTTYSRYITMFPAGTLITLFAIFLGWCIPSWLFDITDKHIMLLTTSCGFVLLSVLAWELSARDCLPHLLRSDDPVLTEEEDIEEQNEPRQRRTAT